jgi:proline iminopeptidase
VPLYWREDGPADAPPLVLLHGGPGASHDYLYPQMLALAETHRVITYDQRGGGRSKTDDQSPITWRTQVADLAALLAEFAIDTPTLVGYSWGALLAMLYSIERATPDINVAARSIPSRLALISPAPITRPWRDEFERELLERQRGPVIRDLRAALSASGLREQDPVAYKQRSFELSVAGYFADPLLAHALTPFRVIGRVQQSIWDSLGAFDLRDGLRQFVRAVPRPVLVVHGLADPIPRASSLAVSDALGATFVELAACGHVPYVEQPAALFEATARFLSS